jgi:hypothetical protein
MQQLVGLLRDPGSAATLTGAFSIVAEISAEVRRQFATADHPQRQPDFASLNPTGFVRSSTEHSCSIKPPQITMALKCAFPAATPKRGP